MKALTKQQKALLKSALRHFILVALPVWQVSNGDTKAFIYGVLAAVIGPAIRGIDKNDPAFGKVADWVEKDLSKKAKPKKPKR